MTLVQQKKDFKNILKKHVNAIHCSNDLTLVQRKLFNALLFNAYHDLSDKLQYTITVKRLCDIIGYTSRDYKKLKNSIMGLITTGIEWSVLDNECNNADEKWRASAVVSAAKIENGVCTYEFSSVMRELLHHPEIYGKVDINIMSAFTSSYGLALYENCIRFQNVSSTPWLPINTFRKLMGISDSCYRNFCDLKKRVLDIAVNEVNLYAPIDVMPEIQRINRKVTGIKFKLSPKKMLSNDANSTMKEIDDELLKVLQKDFSFSDKAALDVLSQYDPEFVRNKINLIKVSGSFRSGRIREIAAYLIDALKRDYKPSKSSKTLLKEIQTQEESTVKEQKTKEALEQAKLNKQKKQLITRYLNGLSEDKVNEIKLSFQAKVLNSNDSYAIKVYKKSGMDSRMMQALYNCYVLDIINNFSEA